MYLALEVDDSKQAIRPTRRPKRSIARSRSCARASKDSASPRPSSRSRATIASSSRFPASRIPSARASWSRSRPSSSSRSPTRRRRSSGRCRARSGRSSSAASPPRPTRATAADAPTSEGTAGPAHRRRYVEEDGFVEEGASPARRRTRRPRPIRSSCSRAARSRACSSRARCRASSTSRPSKIPTLADLSRRLRRRGGDAAGQGLRRRNRFDRRCRASRIAPIYVVDAKPIITGEYLDRRASRTRARSKATIVEFTLEQRRRPSLPQRDRRSTSATTWRSCSTSA